MITKSRIAGAKKSLTIWFNSLAGTLAIALPFAQEALPEMQAYLPTNTYQWLMGAVVLGNILLRFKTVSDLAHK
jgi:hypothetical protein